MLLGTKHVPQQNNYYIPVLSVLLVSLRTKNMTPPNVFRPCMAFLEAMTTSTSTTYLAHRTWLKWNRTIVNRWKKNCVALYVQPNVRLLLWTDPDLHTKYDRFLPPAPPMRLLSKDSLTSVGSAAPSPSQPLDYILGPERCSPWSGRQLVPGYRHDNWPPSCCFLQTSNSTGAASPGWRGVSSTWPVWHSKLSSCD